MKLIKRIIAFIIIAAIGGFGAVLGLNAYVKSFSKNKIVSANELKIDGYDCILVLGAGVKNDGMPSHMLEDRLLCAIDLYEKGVAPKIIMSGDHGRVEYDEVNTMKNFAIEKGVPSEDIFMDHAGFSTYESMYRAKDIFEVEKMVVVTQEYHLYRAIYLAENLGIETIGVSADLRSYVGDTYREAREMLARSKDFFYAIVKPEPTYLGEAIPVSGNGNITNDK